MFMEPMTLTVFPQTVTDIAKHYGVRLQAWAVESRSAFEVLVVDNIPRLGPAWRRVDLRCEGTIVLTVLVPLEALVGATVDAQLHATMRAAAKAHVRSLRLVA